MHYVHILIYQKALTCSNRNTVCTHTGRRAYWYLPCGFLQRVWGNHSTHAHTHSHFRLFSPISFIYQSSNSALSNGYSLVACFRGMEFTARVSVSERDWERVRKRASHRGEREGVWMERRTQRSYSYSSYVLEVERCWRKNGRIVLVSREKKWKKKKDPHDSVEWHLTFSFKSSLSFTPQVLSLCLDAYSWLRCGNFLFLGQTLDVYSCGVTWSFARVLEAEQQLVNQDGLSYGPGSHNAHPGSDFSLLDSSWILVLSSPASPDTHFWTR